MNVVFAIGISSLGGGVTTLLVALASLTVAVVLGFGVGIARATQREPARGCCCGGWNSSAAFPILVLMYFAFFGLPQLGVRTSSEVAAIAALGLYAGALASEIVRGAIVSIPRGQIEAADAWVCPRRIGCGSWCCPRRCGARSRRSSRSSR